MCGIYGAVERSGCASSLVFSGLKDLEYRGYDSWGIVHAQNSYLTVVKEVGFLPPHIELPPSTVAIGHTRWATNGGVNRENAHPHSDCQGSIALVHNGIVENVSDLKESLSGHIFRSQTDSEVIAHLIEEEKFRYPLTEAVRRVFERLTGANALLVTNGIELAAIQKGSSLVIGKTEGGFVISSDANALLPHTQNLHFLKDSELVILGKSEPSISFTLVDWKYQGSSLEQSPHFMLKEILETPSALDHLLEDDDQIRAAAKFLDQRRNIFLLGCGSAYYASLAGDYLLSGVSNRLAYCYPASEFFHRQHCLSQEDVVVAVSQSGETIDLLEQVRESQRSKIPTLAVLNTFGSALYREVPTKIMLNAGIEKAVVATKSFTNMLAVFILMAHQIAGNFKQGKEIILKSRDAVYDIFDKQQTIQEITQTLSLKNHLFILGRGLSYPLALEAALKIKEASYLHAEGFSGGELKHGVLALVEEDMPVVAFTGTSEEDILTNVSEVKARGGCAIGVGILGSTLFDKFYALPPIGDSEIIPKAVFGQLLGYYLALARGTNPDKPRNLAKSVTVK